MRYTLLILAIDNSRAQKIVAHNLAGNRRISLSYAQSLLENVPVEYLTDLAKDDAEAKLRQLAAIGVRGKIVPVDIKAAPIREGRDEEAPESPPPAAVVPGRQPTPEMIPVPSRGTSFVYKEMSSPVTSLKNGALKKRLFIAGFLALFIGAAAVGIIFGRKRSMRLALQTISLSVANTAPAKKPIPADRGEHKAASSADQQRSNAYADSGKAAGAPAGAVAFYKLAIGINKHNVNAWYGLIAAYTALGSDAEAQKARDGMEAIFGKEIFSLQKTVEQFGALLDAYTSADNTVHLEYRSRKTDPGVLLHETFLLARAVGTNRNVAAISLYAHASKGAAGVLVYAPADLTAGTYSDYRAAAKIIAFDGAERTREAPQ